MTATVSFLDALTVVGLLFGILIGFAILVALTERDEPDPPPEPEPFDYEHRAYGRRPVEEGEQVGIVSAEHSAWKKAA